MNVSIIYVRSHWWIAAIRWEMAIVVVLMPAPIIEHEIKSHQYFNANKYVINSFGRMSCCYRNNAFVSCFIQDIALLFAFFRLRNIGAHGDGTSTKKIISIHQASLSLYTLYYTKHINTVIYTTKKFVRLASNTCFIMEKKDPLNI